MELLEPTDAQRPFKIFLSLQDKWEVGNILAERLSIPALIAIKTAVTREAPLGVSSIAPHRQALIV
jgi:hypothetical protein